MQRHLPGYRFRTLALPMGAYPKELGWAISGGLNGSTYRHDAILMVAGGAAPRRTRGGLTPITCRASRPPRRELGYWLGLLRRNPRERYVSDGDAATITVPPAAEPASPGAGRGARVVERP